MALQAYFENIAHHIIEEIEKANEKILIAVAWFTDSDLFEILLQKANSGLEIELILINDRINKIGKINHNSLNIKNSKVYWIDVKNKSIMHNKFCILDNNTVISGSYNWTRQAKNNFENITIIKDEPTIVNKFNLEFNTIKENKIEHKYSLSQICKRLEILKNSILLEDEEDVEYNTKKIKTLGKNIPENFFDLKNLFTSVDERKYSDVINEIDFILNKFQSIIVYDDPEIASIRLELKSLELDISSLEDEKSDIEKLINHFNIQHNRELGSIILRILKIRKEKYKQAKLYDPDTNLKYKEAKKDYEDYKNAFDKEVTESVIELSDDDLILIKKLYRKASRLCHPDIVADEHVDRAKTIFQELNAAFRKNDLNRIKTILDLLERGEILIPKSEGITESKLLRSKVTELKNKRTKLIQELNEFRNNQDYIFIKSLEDWRKYFSETKNKLKSELLQFESEFK